MASCDRPILNMDYVTQLTLMFVQFRARDLDSRKNVFSLTHFFRLLLFKPGGIIISPPPTSTQDPRVLADLDAVSSFISFCTSIRSPQNSKAVRSICIDPQCLETGSSVIQPRPLSEISLLQPPPIHDVMAIIRWRCENSGDTPVLL